MAISIHGLQQVFEESVSAVTATNSVQLGTERRELGVKYLYVYNKSTSTAATRYGVTYSGSSGYSVTVSSVAGSPCAGVVVHTDLQPATYGWIAVKGPVALQSNGVSAIVDGNRIQMAADGTFTRTTGGTGYTGVLVGTASGATTTAGTFSAFINLG